MWQNRTGDFLIEELIVVEGKNDAHAVRRALGDVDVLWTEGYGLTEEKLAFIAETAKKRGVIILTDPDSVGERIRARIRRRVPEAQHVFLSQQVARRKGDIGVENASVEEIRRAFVHVQKSQTRIPGSSAQDSFTMCDLVEAGLAGRFAALEKRRETGRLLGIGEPNAKQFLSRLNRFGIRRTDFWRVVKEVEAGGER